MKIERVNQNHPQAMALQSVGTVKGSPAIEIKPGSRLMWNFGSTSDVIAIVKETKHTITVLERCTETGYTAPRRLNKTRLVAILQD